ncbi:MAG: cyclodeaminase/cyclohydrolase family protein [Erysipelotrichales bacterium]|nr:cyclodeaminase/cyclohydrolase family protein [Erysipelotrichales bacterium]
MKLIDYTVEGFAKELASDSPAPGGGSVAALEAAFGTGLVMMVCELTKGKKKYAEFAESASSVYERAKKLHEELLELVDKDTEAFNLVSAAFGMPKNTEEEKTARSAAIQEGLKECCNPPLNVMRKAKEVLCLVAKLADGYNTSCASDLGTGVLSLAAGAKGAYMNVLINAGSLKDQEYAEEKKREANDLCVKITELSEELYKKVLAEL